MQSIGEAGGARGGASPLGASRASRAREDGLWWRGRAGLSCASGDRATDGYPSRAQALNSSRDDGMAPLRSREGLPWPAHPEEDGKGGRDGVTACPSLRVGETRSRRTRGNGSGGRRGHRISRVLREHFIYFCLYCQFFGLPTGALALTAGASPRLACAWLGLGSEW